MLIGFYFGEFVPSFRKRNPSGLFLPLLETDQAEVEPHHLAGTNAECSKQFEYRCHKCTDLGGNAIGCLFRIYFVNWQKTGNCMAEDR